MSSIPVPKSMTDCDIDAHRDQVAREEAFYEGLRAGRMLLSPSLNPYAPGEAGYPEWERGRLTALTEYARRVA